MIRFLSLTLAAIVATSALADPPRFTGRTLPFSLGATVRLNQQGDCSGLVANQDGTNHVEVLDSHGNLSDYGSVGPLTTLYAFDDLDRVLAYDNPTHIFTVYTANGPIHFPNGITPYGLLDDGTIAVTQASTDAGGGTSFLLYSYDPSTGSTTLWGTPSFDPNINGSMNISASQIDPVSGNYLGIFGDISGYQVNYIGFGKNIFAIFGAPVPFASPNYVNGRGDVQYSADQSYLYHQGQNTPLPKLPGYSNSNWLGLNNSDWVVGQAYNGSAPGSPAMLDIGGTTYDLSTLVDGFNGTLVSAMSVNDGGQILAIATDPSNNNEFCLLTPTTQFSVATSANISSAGTAQGGGVFLVGATDTVNATPNTGSLFVGWTENGSLASVNPSYTFTVGANRSLVANFSYAPPSVGASPHVLTGSASSTGTVSLGHPALTDTVVNLTSDTPYISVPATVTISAGSAGATFPITTTPVPVDQVNGHVTASGPMSAFVTVSVLTAKPTLLSCSPTSAVGGTSANFTLTLDAPAPAGGLTFTLSADHSLVDTSIGTVTVPEGATSLNFSLPTNPVSIRTLVLVTAQHNAYYRRCGIVIAPH